MIKKIMFLGSKKSGYKALEEFLTKIPAYAMSAILCPDDTDDPRSQLTSFSAIASKYSVPFHLIKTKNEFSTLISQYDPHTVIVHGWYRLILVDDFPEVDFLGFHYSALPYYRGNAPLVWQIINGEKKIGVSFFKLNNGIDDGDLIDQKTFELLESEDISVAIEKADEVVAQMIAEFIPRWLSGSVDMKAQPNLIPSYCGLRLPQDGKINWGANAIQVNNFIRAQTKPYPGAFTLLDDGCVVRVWRAEVDSRNFFGVPGSILEVSDDGLVVACAEGAIKILSINIEGETKTSSLTKLRSIKTRFV